MSKHGKDKHQSKFNKWNDQYVLYMMLITGFLCYKTKCFMDHNDSIHDLKHIRSIDYTQYPLKRGMTWQFLCLSFEIKNKKNFIQKLKR